ncbi:hypothetical protein EPUS_04827 [Endocarpon pusillum Z07020]|uniref:Uncharacterized protein n=1 Tax=Endocarpon pusillum (strain Z07020 / HMAS-L-300199) TaxID=1263415 RepID=U1HWB2_ENDPU|nr:uncharacterized protein EPUS_04827 [Endocarpon pusillum Z07020]ERF75045.1 hypothetical protein EPUS_04827 [Endocarpon pusillum Z07020]
MVLSSLQTKLDAKLSLSALLAAVAFASHREIKASTTRVITTMSAGINPVCRSCCLLRPTSAAVRTFTSSSTRGAIPPESPNFVDIPGTFQTDFFPLQRQKGILPVPREIFPARQPDKPSQQYLSRAIPPRKKTSSKPLSNMTEEEKYKARMTDLRRQHLRSGLLELYNRKQAMTAQMSSRSTARQKERARLMTQPSQDRIPPRRPPHPLHARAHLHHHGETAGRRTRPHLRQSGDRVGYSRRGRVEYLEPGTACHDRGVVAGRFGKWGQAGDGKGGAEGRKDEISSGSAEDEEDCRGVEWWEDVKGISEL